MKNKPLGTKFWDRWLKANELERLKIVEELPLFRGEHTVETIVSSTLINSYFVDLANHLEVKNEPDPNL